MPEVLRLCEETACSDPVILAIEPSRATAIKPRTMDIWSGDYRRLGLAAFIRKAPDEASGNDKRMATISVEAAAWLERNWRKYPSPKKLHQAWERQAVKQGWAIASYGWVYNKYKSLPSVVSTIVFEGQKKYTDRLAPFVPRTVIDLDALQMLCGDHSQRDVTVILPDGSLTRPWLTLWLDLRTYLCWGWHLDLVPSSQTIALAYANGVQTFGAQPIYPPETGKKSELYVDQGRDYRSKTIEGQWLNLGQAATLDTGFETLCHQQRVGLVDELGLKHRMARGYNAREKPVERVHADISRWEQNTFVNEYCGRNAASRSDRWHDAFRRHQKLRKKVGKNIEWLIAESPFMTFDSYRDNFAGWLHEHNTTEHTRTVLNGSTIVPMSEYERLYTTRFEIRAETLALLLMKTTTRKIGKNGISLFQFGWYFLHEAMSEFKGETVEVRYNDGDYTRVWVVLPNRQTVEAEMVTQSSIVNPNRQAVETIARTRNTERRLARDHQMLQQSNWRGETIEDRVAAMINPEDETPPDEEQKMAVNDRPVVHAFNRFDGRQSSRPAPVTAEQIEKANVIEGMFGEARPAGRIKEEWED